MKQNYLPYIIAAFAALGGLLFGYDTGAISGALLFLKKELSLSTFQQESVVSSLLLAAAFTAPFAGTIADKIGRKKVIIMAALLFIVGAFVMMLSTSFAMLLFGRVFVGMAIGTASMTVPLYVSEISPPSIRGMCVSLNQLMVTIGIVVAYFVDYTFSKSENWRAMLGISAVPALMLLIAMIPMPKSPRWLMKVGLVDEAKRTFNKLGLSVPRENEEPEGSWKEVFNPKWRKALFLGMGLAILQQVTGINTIIYYAPTILSTVVSESDTASILSTVGVGIVNVISTIIAIFLIDRIGRRPLLIWGTSLMCLSLLGLTLPKSALLYNVCLFTYIIGFAIGLGPIAWLFIAEIYPQHIRGKAMSLAVFANWFCNFIVAMTFLSILDTLGAPLTFSLYAAMSAATVLFVFFYIPETKGKSLEEIETLISL